MSWRRAVAALALAAVATGAGAAIYESRDFNGPEHERTYREIIEELRCLVCQNQSVADSDADLALDLRREVFEMLADGATEREVLDFMVQRYGDFVLYRPPLKPSTVALWLGPFVLVAVALLVLVRQVRRRESEGAPAQALSAADRSRLQELTGSDRPD